jgi:glycosyltransferase involved in cell wall biosynthesis
LAPAPLVTIIVPVKDGARFLAQALGDVAEQTYDHWEVVVVDGGSTDGSADIARSFPRVRVIDQPGEGLSDAWNRGLDTARGEGLSQAWNLGLDAARGELIAFLDSDDRWSPNKLAAQVSVLCQEPPLAYVITRMRFFLEPGETYPPGFRPKLLDGDHVANMPSALLARRSVFDTIGTFPAHYPATGDIDWFARLKDSGLAGGVIPEVLVWKRVHDANASSSGLVARKLNRELLSLLRESVARQRA